MSAHVLMQPSVAWYSLEQVTSSARANAFEHDSTQAASFSKQEKVPPSQMVAQLALEGALSGEQAPPTSAFSIQTL
jgi:fatty acid desaturase